MGGCARPQKTQPLGESSRGVLRGSPPGESSGGVLPGSPPGESPGEVLWGSPPGRPLGSHLGESSWGVLWGVLWGSPPGESSGGVLQRSPLGESFGGVLWGVLPPGPPQNLAKISPPEGFMGSKSAQNLTPMPNLLSDCMGYRLNPLYFGNQERMHGAARHG